MNASNVLQATLHDMVTLVGDGYHNAFTSMIRWRDWYYIAYRQAQGHNPPTPGKIVILRAHHQRLLGPPQTAWTKVVELNTPGDDRDPKLFATDNEMYCYFGTYYPRWGTQEAQWGQTIPNRRVDLISHVCVSHDGLQWSTPLQLYRPNYWIWSVTEETTGLTALASYVAAAYQGGEDGDSMSTHLLRSEDLVSWATAETIACGSRYLLSEPYLFWYKNVLYCLQRDGDEDNAVLSWRCYREMGEPYWQNTILSCPIHAACVVYTPYGILVGGRSLLVHEKKPKRFVWSEESHEYIEHRMTLWHLDVETQALTHLLDLPSGRDCAYPGMVWDEEGESLLVTYYSQHETPKTVWPPHAANLYLAKVTLCQD